MASLYICFHLHLKVVILVCSWLCSFAVLSCTVIIRTICPFIVTDMWWYDLWRCKYHFCIFGQESMTKVEEIYGQKLSLFCLPTNLKYMIDLVVWDFYRSICVFSSRWYNYWHVNLTNGNNHKKTTQMKLFYLTNLYICM